MKLTTNNVPRDLIYFSDLTEKEQKNFDWYDDDENSGLDFFRYRGNAYCLSEFMRVTKLEREWFKDWDGYMSDSYFSGIVVRYVNDFEQVVVGSYYS